MDYVRLYFDDGRLGCGYRAVLIESVGRVWARVVAPAQGVAVKIPRETLRSAKPIELRHRKVAKQLRAAGFKALARQVLVEAA